jgi:uncharacterized membrane protein YbhN (UPF0104 family)
MTAEHRKGPRHVALPAEALGARPGPWSVLFKVLSAALSGGLIVLLFAAIIPKVADFDGVGASLEDMSPLAILALFAMAVAIRLLLAKAYMVLTEPVTFSQSLIAREASSAVSNVIPGPSGTASQFIILQSFGVTAERYARATLAVGVSTNVLILAAPGLFFVLWALLGMPDAADGDNEWAFGLGAIALSALTVTVVGAIGRSVALARRVGVIAQACVNPFMRLFDKERIASWPERAVQMRTETGEELKEHGPSLLACVVLGYLLNGILLVCCLWACGISLSAMPLSLGLMLYSVGRIATIVNITPGGVGVVEIAYTAVYVAVLGDRVHDEVVAGVLVYRALTYLLPIITGAIAYVVWRVIRHRQRREEGEQEAPKAVVDRDHEPEHRADRKADSAPHADHEVDADPHPEPDHRH